VGEGAGFVIKKLIHTAKSEILFFWLFARLILNSKNSPKKKAPKFHRQSDYCEIVKLSQKFIAFVCLIR
jgi:hypothetical protein